MATSNYKTYLSSIMIAFLVILPFFLFQIFFVYEKFEAKFILAPMMVSTILGTLIGRIRILKADILKREKLFHAIANEAKEFSYYKSLDGSYLYVSPAVKELTGYSKEDFLKTKEFFASLIIEEDQQIWRKHIDAVTHTQQYDEIEFRIRTKQGDTVWVNHNCSMVYEENNPVGFRSVNTDISQRKIDESKITHMAMHDSLTALPNRIAIFDELDKRIAEKLPFSILFLDLNRFKKINDSFGHRVGDEILRQVTHNLLSGLQKNFTGRLGGDEFIVILDNATKERVIQPFIDELFGLIEKDYTIDDLVLYIGLSIGVASFPNDATDKHGLLACADKAMYKAKEHSSVEFVYYKDILEEHLEDEFILEKELRMALKNHDLSIHFQPKINTKKNTIHSFEALIRWEMGSRSISPLLFIPIAEKTGLIKQITHFVIDEVFSVAKIWQAQGSCHKFSINISVIDFMSDHLITFIRSALRKHQVDPSWFEIEMTENLFLEKTESIRNRLQTLMDMGFDIALDDFGTGYSSLACITKFPIKTLKIDKTFIANLTIDYEKNFPLLKSIVTLANELNLNIIAEGVETQKELDTLTSLGCHIVQGHYFSKALPLDQLEILHTKMASQPISS